SPECMGWWFVKQQGGGAIATFGCTGLGYGTIGDDDKDGVPDCIQYLLTWLELRFFEVYKNGNDILGKTWGTAITDYINRFMTGRIDQADAKTVEEWILLGDPTLKIGGYV
ncbi:MAG: C25 family cysteine peptidase, partial [Candidatus Thermoplasmatota archaeon]